jgi:hypothetical protein
MDETENSEQITDTSKVKRKTLVRVTHKTGICCNSARAESLQTGILNFTHQKSWILFRGWITILGIDTFHFGFYYYSMPKSTCIEDVHKLF